MPPASYRLGFAVKVLGAREPLKEADKRRWQSGPHLRHSIQLLNGVWDHLERIDVRMYRMSSSGTPRRDARGESQGPRSPVVATPAPILAPEVAAAEDPS